MGASRPRGHCARPAAVQTPRPRVPTASWFRVALNWVSSTGACGRLLPSACQLPSWAVVVANTPLVVPTTTRLRVLPWMNVMVRKPPGLRDGRLPLMLVQLAPLLVVWNTCPGDITYALLKSEVSRMRSIAKSGKGLAVTTSGPLAPVRTQTWPAAAQITFGLLGCP